MAEGGRLWIPGQPVPAPRIKVGRWGAYYGKAYGTWLPAAREYAESAWDGGRFEPDVLLDVSLEIWVARPKSHYGTGKNANRVKPGQETKYPTPNGDVDNYAKGPLDALAGVAYYDDKQIIRLSVMKSWTEDTDHWPGVRVEIAEA